MLQTEMREAAEHAQQASRWDTS